MLLSTFPVYARRLRWLEIGCYLKDGIRLRVRQEFLVGCDRLQADETVVDS